MKHAAADAYANKHYDLALAYAREAQRLGVVRGLCRGRGRTRVTGCACVVCGCVCGCVASVCVVCWWVGLRAFLCDTPAAQAIAMPRPRLAYAAAVAKEVADISAMFAQYDLVRRSALAPLVLLSACLARARAQTHTHTHTHVHAHAWRRTRAGGPHDILLHGARGAAAPRRRLRRKGDAAARRGRGGGGGGPARAAAHPPRRWRRRDAAELSATPADSRQRGCGGGGVWAYLRRWWRRRRRRCCCCCWSCSRGWQPVGVRNVHARE
jgi:hypothetical protein